MPQPVVDAFTAAVVNMFEELCQTPATPGEPFLSNADPIDTDVVAEIVLRRKTPGRLRLEFPRPVLATLAVRFLPKELPLSPEILDDTAGEFSNVIAGQAKTMLKGTPYHFLLSTPRVGTDVPVSGEWLVLPFEIGAGAFAVLVQLPPCEE
ncbi:MAG TPA: chemotaxis protein CheX [Fimbriiglobus sp.]